jgi:hypothetical protein
MICSFCFDKRQKSQDKAFRLLDGFKQDCLTLVLQYSSIFIVLLQTLFVATFLSAVKNWPFCIAFCDFWRLVAGFMGFLIMRMHVLMYLLTNLLQCLYDQMPLNRTVAVIAPFTTLKTEDPSAVRLPK